MITVIGATGFTGKLVARALATLETKYCLTGRSPQKLEETVAYACTNAVERPLVKRVDVSDPSSFAALEGSSVLINCAGPFTELGEPVLRWAVENGAHYLDTTGEQPFINFAYQKFGQKAQEANLVVVPACAFEYALGDALAAMLADALPGLSRLEIYYSISKFAVSAGTKRSALKAMMAKGYRLVGGRLVESQLAQDVRELDIRGKNRHAYSFAAGEPVMIPLHLPQVKDATSYMAIGIPPLAASMARGLLGLASGAGLEKLLRQYIDVGGTADPSAEERQTTEFEIVGLGYKDRDSRRLHVSGNDPYGITGELVAKVAHHLTRSQPETYGAVSPSMIAGPGLIRESIQSFLSPGSFQLPSK